jgi:iron complex outermembrane receptor protein
MQIASRVQLIDAEDIANSGATDLVQLLRKEANLYFRSTSGNSAQSEVSMGGFGENSGQRVLILLDGHRLNTADLGQINWLSIPLGLIESVEVIQGGQSALYGNNAAGGVIKINTRRPTDQLAGQAQVSVGSFDSYNGRFALTGAKGGLGYSVHAEHDETDGYRENSQFEADAAGLKLEWNSGDWFSAFVSFNAVESEYGLPGPLNRAEVAEDYNQSTEEDNYGEEKTIYTRSGVGICLNDHFSLGLSGAYVSKDVYALYLDPFFSETKTNYDLYSLNPTLRYEDEALTVSVGLDYFKDEIDVRASYGDTDFERDTMAAYASLSLNLNEDLIFTSSARVSRAQTDGVQSGIELDEVDDEQVAWSIGLVQQLGSNARIYTTARRFFRYASTDELIQYLPPFYNPSTNLNLDAEHGHELEVGSDWVYGNLSLGGRIFYQWMNDEIIYDGGSGNINLDQTRRFGGDLDAKYVFFECLSMSFNYTWVQAMFKGGDYDGSEVPLVPEHKFRLEIDYRLSEAISCTFGASYTDDSNVGGDFVNKARSLDDHILFNVGARYVMNENVEFFISVDNLFDKEYISTAFGPDALYPGVGRSGRVGLLYKF